MFVLLVLLIYLFNTIHLFLSLFMALTRPQQFWVYFIANSRSSFIFVFVQTLYTYVDFYLILLETVVILMCAGVCCWSGSLLLLMMMTSTCWLTYNDEHLFKQYKQSKLYRKYLLNDGLNFYVTENA